MRYQKDEIRAGKVSVWVGSISSEDELIEYVDDGAFARDFDFTPSPSFGREIIAVASPQPIPELVKGFSGAAAFATACAERAQGLGILTCRCMVVLYSAEYTPHLSLGPKSRLTFVGVFDY